VSDATAGTRAAKLTYNTTTTVEFDERLLAHLHVVIAAKLSRGEGFEFSWTTDPSAGSGRDTLWIGPGIPVEFRYYSNKRPSINPAWLTALMETAQLTGGLRVVPEPTDRTLQG